MGEIFLTKILKTKRIKKNIPPSSFTNSSPRHSLISKFFSIFVRTQKHLFSLYSPKQNQITQKNPTCKMQSLERRSCRTFTTQPIEKDKLEQILHSGRHAPTGLNKQELHFHVVTTPDLLKSMVTKIQESFKAIPGCERFAENKIIYEAPAVIVVTCKKSELQWAKYDCGFAMQNMMVCADMLGLCTLPIGIPTMSPNVWLKELNCEEDDELLLSLCIGYPGEDYKKEVKELTSKVTYH